MTHNLNTSLKDLFTGVQRIIPSGEGNSRSDWLNLKPNMGAQDNCNEQGFNKTTMYLGEVIIMAKLGYFMNNENECNTCDTFIGIGIKTNIHFII